MNWELFIPVIKIVSPFVVSVFKPSLKEALLEAGIRSCDKIIYQESK